MLIRTWMRRNIGMLFIAGALAQAAHCIAWADETPKDPPTPAAAADQGEIDLGEIAVPGQAPAPPTPAPTPPPPPPTPAPQPERSGAQATVITAQQIATSGAQNLAELLQRLAGFTVTG